MTIDIDLDHLEATAKAATLGTWYAVDDWDGFTFVVFAGAAIAEVLPSNENRGEDAEHIAAARPEVVLALIERLRKAEAPTPPADVDHEVLVRELHPDYPSSIPAVNQLYEDHANRFLARFEVRPREPITDAKVEAVESVARLLCIRAPHLHAGDSGAWMDLARDVLRNTATEVRIVTQEVKSGCPGCGRTDSQHKLGCSLRPGKGAIFTAAREVRS